MKCSSFSGLMIISLFGILSLVSCDKANQVPLTDKMIMGYDGSSIEMASADQAAKVSKEAPAPVQAGAQTGRKLVYTADMSIEARDINVAETAIVARVEKDGGYVASRSGDESSVYLVLRLPVPALEPLMKEVAGTGKTLSRSMSAQDVTDQFFDLEGRLRNKRILEERYRDYLKQAKKIEEMLEVEKRLSETTTEIEALEGSFRDLSKQIELSTLTVSIRKEYADDPYRPGFLKSLGNLFASFGYTMGSAIVVIMGILLYGIPLIIFIALVWLLAFGRVGLVRKLFALVRGTKDQILK